MRSSVWNRLLLLSSICAAAAAPVFAQTPDPQSLAARASIVVLGTVTRTQASDEPLLPPTPKTVVIRIERMYAGGEFVGDLTGKTATVVLAGNGDLAAGRQLLFFGAPRFAGKSLTIADISEIPLAAGIAPPNETEIERGVQARRDAPIRARLAIAAAVFRGKVEKVEPIPEPQNKRTRGGGVDEHDPEFHIAFVRVESAASGVKAGRLVPVLFPASRDIIWFKTAKLKAGEEVVIIGHRPQEYELALLRSTGALAVIERDQALLATDVYDILPVSEEKRVTDLLRTKEPQS